MPPADPVASWNLLTDVQELWSFPFMVNAFRAGTIVAVLAGAIGWFMVLRKQSFAGHTLAMVSFPGAAGATLIGVSTAYGYFGFCVAAALVIAARPRTGGADHAEESAVTGTVQAFALACGFLFIALYKGFLDGVTALLFGSLLGVTDGQVLILLIVAVIALGTLAVIGRPLLFASIDPDVAAARGIPTRALAAVFLVLLGAAVAEASQLTGALLVFALLVMPAATAQVLTARPGFSLVLSVVIGVLVTWFGLGVAFYSQYPIGFFVTTFAFVLYVVANAVKLGLPKLRTAWSPA
ncbi:MAG TPA: metal ABC transporter permease [Pseudonocardiaceae bacterium]|jgi:zinc/manganese transport system permease protein|nr:metal ABC transporter permease [Pseudonocardiaceae bacterium]